MGWLTGKQRRPGWLALGWNKDRSTIDLVHLVRGPAGKPAVTLCESFRKEGTEALTLARLRKNLKLDRYRCTTLMPGSQYQLHYMDAPAVPADEVKAAVRWRVKDVIDYSIESATVDVLLIPGEPDAPSREQALYAITARNADIAACARPFEESGIALQAIDIVDLAQRNLTALLEHGEEGAAMLAFYDDRALLTFTRGGELLLSRSIEVSVGELLEDGKLSEAALDRVALEAQRSLDHFDYRFPRVSIAKLMLAPLPHDENVAARLSTSLGIPVEQVDLTEVIDFDVVPQGERRVAQSHFARLIGAALRSNAGPAP